MADETNETPDVDSGLLDPQLSLSDELLLDQDDLGEDQAPNKKSSEEIPNIEDDDPVGYYGADFPMSMLTGCQNVLF